MNPNQQAEAFLRKVDPVMDRLICKYGSCPIGSTKPHSLFHSLASAIIAQQLSVKAAETIQKRVMRQVSKPLSPRKYQAANEENLRSAGLSKPKISYIRNLADAIEGGLSKRKLQSMQDAEVAKELTAIKGIGQWTAEMYLIFDLIRPDIVSLGDAGLQRAARNLYNNGDAEEGLLEHVSAIWKPYRSIGCWYLWQSLENTD
ncbi:MAG: hypothetical protein OES84_03075 [Kiritimatiellaceae bacterium]|nr:hypothetical protein [Kiritimatiellaceae bacterium]